MGGAASMRWRCGNCNAITPEAELLRAPNPFDPTTSMHGCTVCKSVHDEVAHDMGDEPGCPHDAGCGWPTGKSDDACAGYRRTCSAHVNWSRPNEKAP